MNNINNPQMKALMGLLKGNANPEELVKQKCQQMGINFDDFINALRRM